MGNTTRHVGGGPGRQQRLAGDRTQSAKARSPFDRNEYATGGVFAEDRIYRLWDTLSDFDVGETDRALEYLLARLCEWVNAENAFWVGAVRIVSGFHADNDPMSGWRGHAVHVLRPGYADKRRQKFALREMHSDTPGETSQVLAADAGHFRVYSLRSGGLVDLDAFEQTQHYHYHYRQRGVSDRLWVVFPLNPDVEAYYCFDKYGSDRRFDLDEMRLAAHALRGIKWFHRQLLLLHGLGMTESPLTPAERGVLRWLMTGLGERAIAERLGITPGSGHQYITTIYRKFGVRSRNALMSLWMGGAM